MRMFTSLLVSFFLIGTAQSEELDRSYDWTLNRVVETDSPYCSLDQMTDNGYSSRIVIDKDNHPYFNMSIDGLSASGQGETGEVILQFSFGEDARYETSSFFQNVFIYGEWDLFNRLTTSQSITINSPTFETIIVDLSGTFSLRNALRKCVASL